MNKNISSVIKSCFLHLSDFHCIRPFISKAAAINLAYALVQSHVDFYNISSFMAFLNNLFKRQYFVLFVIDE